MFEKAKQELARAETALAALQRAADEREFLTRFNDFIASAQLVLIALLKEGRTERLPGFDRWYDEKVRASRRHDALEIVREARDYDFDTGPHRLRFVSHPGEVRGDELGRPVAESAWCALPRAPNVHVALEHAPEYVHDHKLERTDPMSVAAAIVAYLDEMLDDAAHAVDHAQSRDD